MKNNSFKFKVLTPNGNKFFNDIEEINFLANGGYLSILKNHTPIIGIIKKGKCLIKINGKNFNYYHSEGAFSFINNELKFILDKWDEKEIKFQSLNLFDDKKVFIGNNEIITNYRNNSENNKLIEFQFKKIIKNIK